MRLRAAITVTSWQQHRDGTSRRKAARVTAAAVALEAGLGLVALALGFVLSIPAAETLNFGPGAVAAGVFATAPLAVAFGWARSSSWAPLRRMREVLERGLLPELAGLRIWQLALVAAAAGLGEELLFRGFLQAGLQSLLGNAAGLAAASLLFGIAHPLTATYAAVAALMGCYLGWLWQMTGDLAAPVVTHALYDFVALVWMLRVRPGDADVSAPPAPVS